MARRYELAAGLAVGWLVTTLALQPQVNSERARADRLKANEVKLAHRCTFLGDGSATCPPGTFYVPSIPQQRKAH